MMKLVGGAVLLLAGMGLGATMNQPGTLSIGPVLGWTVLASAYLLAGFLVAFVRMARVGREMGFRQFLMWWGGVFVAFLAPTILIYNLARAVMAFIDIVNQLLELWGFPVVAG